MEQGSKNIAAFHLAGIVPVASQPMDFDFPWHDSLQPIAKGFLAVERSVMECAWAGCETIWVICHKEMQPLIKSRLGDYVEDPKRYWNKWERFPKDNCRLIPIFYVPIHPKDRDKRDCLGWSVLYGADTAYRISRSMSQWLIPDRYYVSFPYGVYPPNIVGDYRTKISNKEGFFLTHNGKTVRDGEYLGFTFDADDHNLCRKELRKHATGKYTSTITSVSQFPKETLPLEERWSARFFSLDKIFQCVMIGKDETNTEIPWYYKIDSWDGLCDYLGSEERKEMRKPYKKHMSGKYKVLETTTEEE